ncbi:MAG: cell division inhibitor SulA [Pseudomonadales bacterium]
MINLDKYRQQKLQFESQLRCAEHSAKHIELKSNPCNGSGLLGKVTEIITSDSEHANIPMLLPLLATLSKDDRWFAWISPPKDLPKDLLREAGIALDKVMLLYPDEQHSSLMLAKKALSAGTCHAVISWSGQLSEHEMAGLEKSARDGASHGILIRARGKH